MFSSVNHTNIACAIDKGMLLDGKEKTSNDDNNNNNIHGYKVNKK